MSDERVGVNYAAVNGFADISEGTFDDAMLAVEARLEDVIDSHRGNGTA